MPNDPPPSVHRFKPLPDACSHLGFGVGPRRCIGMHLARTMYQTMMTEVLTRIPDYAVDRAATRFYERNPVLNGVVCMPITFTPGERRGTGTPPFE